MPPKKGSSDVSFAFQAYESLRKDIVTCRLKPNARLRLDELRLRYGVGASPLREALMRLESEGLVLLELNKGFRVVPISKDHLTDVMRVRTEIEVLCLGWSIDQGGVEWESSLVGALHRLKRFSKTAVPSASSSDDWRTAHRAFHSALISACGSELLKSFHSGLFDQVERYIAISVSITDQPRDDISEHEGLMQAALDRQSGEAVVLLRQHHMRTLDKLVNQLFEPEGVAQKGARGKPRVKSASRSRSTTLNPL